MPRYILKCGLYMYYTSKCLYFKGLHVKWCFRINYQQLDKLSFLFTSVSSQKPCFVGALRAAFIRIKLCLHGHFTAIIAGDVE